MVYRALDIKLNRPVALKFVSPFLTQDPVVRERFAREAQAAAAIDHSNICTVHDIAEAALWLADENTSGFINGQVFELSGGQHMGRLPG